MSGSRSRELARTMARLVTPALFLGLALPACRRDREKIDEAAAERAAEKQPSGEREQPGEAPAKADIASSPAELMKPGAVKQIQAALADRGHLQGRPGGGLGGATRTALQKFQRAQKLPETGLPDHETIRRLGLGIDDVFLKNVSGAEASAATNDNRRTDDGQEETRARDESPSELDPREQRQAREGRKDREARTKTEGRQDPQDRQERQGRRERRAQ